MIPLPSYKDALDALRSNPNFDALVTEIVSRRETAIGGLGNYESEVALKKTAAEITVWTDLLDEWGVPVGEARS